MFRIFLTLLLVTVFSLTVTAQFFITKEQPCVFGNKVSLDTIFFTPDKALPFDRCFYLSVKLKGTPKVDFFSVMPIDKFGRKKVRNRDYNAYIRSEYPKSKRKTAKKNYPIGQFKNPDIPLLRLFTDIATFPGPTSTEVILRMPPLDPNRIYKLLLVTQENDVAQQIKTVEDIVLQSAIDAKLTSASYKKTRDSYNDILSRKAATSMRFRKYGFDDFLSQIYDCEKQLKLNDNLHPKLDQLRNRRKYRKRAVSFLKEYRFYLVPSGTLFDSATAISLSPDRFSVVTTENILSQIAPLPLFVKMQMEKKLDIRGNSPDFSTSGNYDLYALMVDTMYSHPVDIEKIDSGSARYKRRILNKSDKTSEVTFLGKLGNASWSFVPPDTLSVLSTTRTDSCSESVLNDYNELTKLKNNISRLSADVYHLNTKSMQFVMERALSCPCEKEGIKDLVQKEDLTRAISFFTDPTSTNLEALQTGMLSLKEPFSLLKADNFDGRMANIKTSISQIMGLEEFILKVKAAFPAWGPPLTTQIDALEKLRLNLDTLTVLHQKTSEIIQKRTNKLVEQFDIRKVAALAPGSTSVPDFVSANKFRIVPDFGLIALFKGDGLKVQDFTPYLGFHINFRSIDKSIEMKDVRYKSWRHYFSFMAGITLKSIKIEGKREDFFGNNSFITGLGFRLNNFFRLTGGAVWFKTIDKYPLSKDKPIGFSPFAGLSVDLELQELFGGIKNLFK